MNMYSLLALLYIRIEDYPKSKKFFKKAIAIDIHEKFATSNYFNLGNLYYEGLKQYDSGAYFYNLGLSYSSKIEKQKNLLDYNIALGNIMLEQNKLDSSFKYYDKACCIPIFENFPQGQAAVYTNLGLFYFKKNKYKQTLEFLEKGISLSIEKGYLLFQAKGYRTMCKLLSSEKNGSKPLNIHRNIKA